MKHNSSAAFAPPFDKGRVTQLPAPAQSSAFGDANAVAIVRHEGVDIKIVTITADKFARPLGKFSRRQLAQTQDTRVLGAIAKHQHAEIGIDGDDRPALGDRDIEDRRVTGISAAFEHVDDVVAIRLQPLKHGERDAAIEQELPLLHLPPQPLRQTCASCRKACRRRAAPP